LGDDHWPKRRYSDAEIRLSGSIDIWPGSRGACIILIFRPSECQTTRQIAFRLKIR
jgi:hypothetical protein